MNVRLMRRKAIYQITPDGACRGNDESLLARSIVETLSMLGREIIKCQEHLAILGQALGRLGILRFIDGNEQVKGHLRPLPVWRHPDRLEALFGLRLEVLGQFV